MNKGHNRAGGIAGDHLQSLIQRIERLEEEKAGIATDIREIYAEGKGNGFDPKTMRQIVRLRKMNTQEREEHEALLDIYKAALGMLDGTPLGEAAIRRLSKQPPQGDESTDENPPSGDDEVDQAATQSEVSTPSIEEARELGRRAAENGHSVTANPFPARDPRRSAWDEEWCRAAGNDGMELPDAWRRSAKKPAGKGDGESKGE